MIGLERGSRHAALLACGAIGLAGLLAGGVRVLPWLLAPSVPWAVTEPFARGLLAVTLESALLAGWPIGWSVACYRFVESGEARVLQTLGERPRTTVGRLTTQGALLAVALGSVAVVHGRDASAPGRVVTELAARSRASCEAAASPVVYPVPFTDFSWLCVRGRPARLFGRVPGAAFSTAVLTAGGAHMAGDLRAIELDDARFSIAGTPQVDLRVGSVAIRGMALGAAAPRAPPVVRALALALAAFGAATVSAYGMLVAPSRTRLGALFAGAAGPLAALGSLRVVERTGAPPWALAAVPIAAAACAALLASLRRRAGGGAGGPDGRDDPGVAPGRGKGSA